MHTVNRVDSGARLPGFTPRLHTRYDLSNSAKALRPGLCRGQGSVAR